MNPGEKKVFQRIRKQKWYKDLLDKKRNGTLTADQERSARKKIYRERMKEINRLEHITGRKFDFEGRQRKRPKTIQEQLREDRKRTKGKRNERWKRENIYRMRKWILNKKSRKTGKKYDFEGRERKGPRKTKNRRKKK